MPEPSSGGNSAAAMLLSLNFILLSFFIVLVAIATAHKGKKELALAGVAAEFARASNASPQPKGPFLPHAGDSGWQNQVSAQVMGMVANRLAIHTPEIEADAARLVVKLPLGAIFNGAVLTDAAQKTLPDLVQLGVSADASVEIWLDESASPAALAQHMQLLAEVAPAVALGAQGTGAQVRLVYRDREKNSSEDLGRLPAAATGMGGEIHGEGR
ncbi:MAG TPA: hypothetical protein VHP58_04025 [Alphaproteobacteria bacterium]|nr:hypothetical protein [Alphaproteobacteria bacterium]